LRKWFEANHSRADEVWIGFYKTGSGKPSVTWPEAVDEAICFGWIDSIRKSVDEHAYKNRFTPRRAGSTWSLVNIKKAERLTAVGLMKPAGLAAFEKRKASKSGIYSFEQEKISFSQVFLKQFKKNAKAWSFFSKQAPSYQRTATWWVMSAKKEETRESRLRQLIEVSLAGQHLKHLKRPG
jgi:uncharacterized protein YdeI (YjbR/CyaY-like superfamily)